MKKLALLLALMCLTMYAQPGSRQFNYVSSDPSGVCSNGTPNQYNYLNNKEWGCNAGTWTQVNSGGGGGAVPAGAFPCPQIYATPSTFGCSANFSYDLTSVSSWGKLGAGLNDLTPGGTYTDGLANPQAVFVVQISATGMPDSFKWNKNGGAFSGNVAITGAAQTLSDGVTVTFGATTGHTLNTLWNVASNSTIILGPGESALDPSLQGYLTGTNLLITAAGNNIGMGLEGQSNSSIGTVGIYAVQLQQNGASGVAAFEGDAYLTAGTAGGYIHAFESYTSVSGGGTTADSADGFYALGSDGPSLIRTGFNGDNYSYHLSHSSRERR